MKTTALACTLAAFALVAACGGGGEATPPPAAPAAPSASEMPTAAPGAAPTESSAAAASAAPSASAAPEAAAPPAAPGPGDWDKWSHDQKLAYMKSAVMPKMKDLFSSFDSAKYGDMKCKTCHGHGAEDGSFKMPNPDLPKLPKTPAEFKALAQKKAKIFTFMKEQVQPTMAQLIGEQPFDPKTMQGFGCMHCHTQK
jgi:hypothetical protein